MVDVLINLGILVVVCLWIIAVYAFPFTIAMTVALRYLTVVGLGGYELHSPSMDLLVVLCLVIDINLWKERSRNFPFEFF